MPHPKSWKVIASEHPHLPMRCAVSNSPLHNPHFCTQTTALFLWDPAWYPTPHRPLVILYPAQTILPWSPSVSLSCQHHAETTTCSFSAVSSLLQTTTSFCFTAVKADLYFTVLLGSEIISQYLPKYPPFPRFGMTRNRRKMLL